ncbi:PH domain-containing protein [Rhodanobacter hydrolyticus]|uniref:Bacterial Pleckstrin homology domain-containing protein n=1 Tax=Rhodanobacter hydrolyticus TaxID=2250595 RepID=A0ABW8J678_9GAMM
MQTSRPAAPWGTFLKGISIAVTLLLLGVFLLVAYFVPGQTLPRVRTVVMVLPTSILLISLLFVVRDYTVHGGVLHVRRLLWTTRVALGELREATIDPNAGAGSIRLFGNGGLFSFSGWFRNAKLGRYRAFVTDWQQAVVLRGDLCTVVLSPADPSGLVRDLQASVTPKVPPRTLS